MVFHATFLQGSDWLSASVTEHSGGALVWKDLTGRAEKLGKGNDFLIESDLSVSFLLTNLLVLALNCY